MVGQLDLLAVAEYLGQFKKTPTPSITACLFRCSPSLLPRGWLSER
jgi:hypothetical protein